MCPRKKASDYYSDEELSLIKERWIKDKNQIEESCKGMYPRDIDIKFEACLNNKNLQALFRHACYLYWGGIIEGELHLYPKEEILVKEVYREIRANGYYSKSKKKEKRIRSWFGKAVSRQTYRRYKKR